MIAGMPFPGGARKSTMNTMPDGHGASVLIVENNAVAALDTTQALRSLGFDPLVAFNLRSAMLALDQPVDVLLTEIALPHFDGFMLADMAKSHRPAIAIVYTAVDMEKAKKCLDHAGQLHGPILNVPCTAEQFNIAIGQALGVTHPYLRLVRSQS